MCSGDLFLCKMEKKKTPDVGDALSDVSVACVFKICKTLVSGRLSHTHAHTHTKLEIAAVYLNEYSQSQCLINVPVFLCQLQSEKQNTLAG